MKPLISIIIPIYNVETYVSKCILSVIQQTYTKLQIILVDDGSTDSSGEKCDGFARIDNRIEVIHRENGGLVSARKAGLAIARGQYIGFVDGDDYIEKNMYEKLIENILFTDADFVHTGYYRGQMLISQLKNEVIDICENKSLFLNQHIFSINEERMNHSVCTKLFKENIIRKSYQEVSDTQSVGEDLLNLIACVFQSKKISILNASYYHYNVRNTSITRKKNEMALLSGIHLFQMIENMMKKYECYDDVKNAFINQWLKGIVYDSLMQSVHDEFKINRYSISDVKFFLGKRVVIYGAGRVGRDYYSQLCRYSKCKVVAWVDENYKNIIYDCADIVGLEALARLSYDVLLIAIKTKENALKIKQNLKMENKVEESKILWIEPENF